MADSRYGGGPDPRALYIEGPDFDTGDIRIGGVRVPREILASRSKEDALEFLRRLKEKQQRDQERAEVNGYPYGELNDNIARYKYEYVDDVRARDKAAQPPEPVKEPESAVPDGPIKPRMPELDL